MTNPIHARIAITPNEWRDLRLAAVAKDKRTSELLAELVRRYLKGRK